MVRKRSFATSSILAMPEKYNIDGDQDNMREYPVLTVDGKDYKLYSTKEIRVFYDEETRKKKADKAFQKRFLDSENAKNRFKKVSQAFNTAEDEYFADLLNAEKEEKYKIAKRIYEEEYAKMLASIDDNDVEDEMTIFTVNLLERIAIKSLGYSAKISEEEAEKLWCKYVDETSVDESRIFLAYVNSCFFDGDVENPLFEKMAHRNQMKQERNASLSKVVR